jgi:microcystin-dependent protein
MEVFIGTILGFAFNYAPYGWAFCNGQIMGITQNQTLFALLGTTYGGNGTTTFGLPDLRGRSPIHFGQGPGLSPIALGQISGTETMTLLQTNLPAHSHTLAGTSTVALSLSATTVTGGTITNETDGGNNSFSSSGSTPSIYSEPGGTGTDKIGGITGTGAIGGNTGLTGGTVPFGIRNPYLAINFCISLNGIFPSRN